MLVVFKLGRERWVVETLKKKEFEKKEFEKKEDCKKEKFEEEKNVGKNWMNEKVWKKQWQKWIVLNILNQGYII